MSLLFVYSKWQLLSITCWLIIYRTTSQTFQFRVFGRKKRVNGILIMKPFYGDFLSKSLRIVLRVIFLAWHRLAQLCLVWLSLTQHDSALLSLKQRNSTKLSAMNIRKEHFFFAHESSNLKPFALGLSLFSDTSLPFRSSVISGATKWGPNFLTFSLLLSLLW